MSFIRSETMHHKNMRIPKHKALPILHELGKLDDCIQFINLNKHLQENDSHYGSMIMRCTEVDRQVQNFFKICESFKVNNNKFEDFESYKDYSNYFDNKMGILSKLPFDYIESEVSNDVETLSEMFSAYTKIEDYLVILQEKQEVWNLLNQYVMNKESNGEFEGRIK